GPVRFAGNTGFDLPDTPYILHLHDAVILPQDTAPTQGNFRQGALPAPFRSKRGRILHTADHRIIPESFFRATRVPPLLKNLGNGQWQGPLPDPEATIDGDCYLLDLVTKHFGHMLMEVPCRQWPDLFDDLREGLRGLTPVAVATHKLHLGMAQWPGYLLRFLRALGVDPAAIRVIDRPTRIASLFIPRRLTPHQDYGTNRNYFDLMARVATRWEAETPTTRTFPERIYLSRSGPLVVNRASQSELRVEQFFTEAGFTIVHPEEMDLADQTRLIEAATHIAGLSGSQMHLAAFRRKPGLRLFRIAFAFHNPDWDNRIGAFTGAEVTNDVVRPLGAGSRDELQDWRLSEADFASLRLRILAWAGVSGADVSAPPPPPADAKRDREERRQRRQQRRG
ncbi:MAG: glycosyltransferase 61 family protein, partial [Gemmobacter sp.]